MLHSDFEMMDRGWFISGVVMLRWIVFLSAVCMASAALGLGMVVPVKATMQSLMFTLTALSATMLISSFDAFETQSVRTERDEES